MNEFKLPDLGEGLQEAEIVKWHVRVGDEVKADQPLVSVETDKAIVEIPSARAGRIKQLHGQPGDIVQVGTVLVEYHGEGAAPTVAPEPQRADAGAVVGEVEAGDQVVEERPSTVGPSTIGVKATPAVRAMARRLNVDLNIVTPSGPEGLVTAADVERAGKTLSKLGPLEPLRGTRRAMARRMTLAREEVAPVTIMDDADVDDWSKGTDVTMRLVRAIAAGCHAEPALNAWYDGNAAGRRILDEINVGIAVDTEEGLFVPVLHDVGNRSPDDLRTGLERLKHDVQARTIPPEEMRGYTITLSNFGTIAGRYASPIVQPPTVAILGAGVIRPEVVVRDGAPAVRRLMPLSLTFDHRAATGGEAARFLKAVIEDLARPD